MRGLLTTILSCLGIITICHSQVPYFEDFSTTDAEGVVGASGGIGNPITTFNACNSQWSLNGDGSGLTGATDYLQVTGGLLEAQDLDSELCFTTSTIDVSTTSSLDFDLLAAELGTHEATDYIDISYIIDGVSTTVPNYLGNGNASHTLIDDFTSITVSLDNIDVSAASSFALEICLFNNAGTEQLQIDDIAIYESGTAAPTSGTPICPVNTIVQFASVASNIAEDGGTVDVCVEIANPDATNATTVEVSLDGASVATEGVGNDFTASPALTATLTFPAGSSTAECVTFTIEDDTDFEGDEDIILNLGNPQGGLGASLGTNTQYSLTILDNDVAACTYTAGGIFITELSYNPCSAQGNDGDCEYVEIYNAYSNTVDLSNWEMTGFAYTFPVATTIPSGGYLVLGISNSNCVDYDLAGVALATGSLTNSGETLNIIDNCGVTVSSITYDNTFANGDCNALGIDPNGTFSAVTPSPGTGNCTPSADPYSPSCGITALGAEIIDCLDYTGSADPVKVSIPYTGVDICATVTNNGSGTIGGDDITAITDGIIEVTLNEGETWNIEITGSGCTGLISTGTVSTTICTATCGVDASASAATVSINSTTSFATVNTLDDAYVSNQQTSFCGADEFDMVYGTLDWDGNGQGTITGLVSTNGTNLGNPYSGIVTYELSEVLQSCAGTGNMGNPIAGTSNNNIISTSQTSMQGNSPKPSIIGPHFTESDGSFKSINMACMNFSVPVNSVTFWIGDVETSDVNPAYIHVYDAAGDLINSEPVPTETPVADQATNCVGSTAGGGYSGCGNNETAFVEVNSLDGISQICIEVGDFPDDNTDPGGTERLSFGGVSLGGVCVDRDPIPVCTDLLAYQDFDGTVSSWSYTANPAPYSEVTDSDIWQARTDPTGGAGTISATGVDNNFYWGLRDINNGGSGGNFEHTLTFQYDISCYENVTVNFDYIANLFEAGDYLAYQIQDENGVDIVSKVDLANGVTTPWTTSSNSIPNTANAITLTLYANQNGGDDSGGFDKVYICGTAIAAAPLTVALDGDCNDSTGTIRMDLSGGIPPYEISGDFSSKIVAAGTGIIIASNLPEDTYSITVSDNCGNEQTRLVTVQPSCALPVDLLYFKATKTGKEVSLDWATASEENNDYFVVEHSLNGKDFREIGRVNGAGNSVVTLNYQHIHTAPVKGNNYYRLKQVDFDERFDYSNIEVVVFDVENDGVISIRPTIGKNNITLVSNQVFNFDANVLIFNTTGQLVTETRLPKGQTSLDINIEQMPAGHYFLKVIDRDIFYTSRFIKQ